MLESQLWASLSHRPSSRAPDNAFGRPLQFKWHESRDHACFQGSNALLECLVLLQAGSLLNSLTIANSSGPHCEYKLRFAAFSLLFHLSWKTDSLVSYQGRLKLFHMCAAFKMGLPALFSISCCISAWRCKTSDCTASDSSSFALVFRTSSSKCSIFRCWAYGNVAHF